MIKIIAIWAAAAVLCGTLAAADSDAEIARQLLALERKAMDGWTTGNPDGDLAISDATITYIHPAAGKRLDGLPALKELFERFRGTPLFDSYEIVEPKVQVGGDMAVLTSCFEFRNGATLRRYYATLVFQHRKEGWRIVHAHWSKAENQ